MSKKQKTKVKEPPEIKMLEEEWVKGKIAYKIKPTPFLLLSNDDREKVISNFNAFLNAINKRVMIYIDPVPREVIIDDESYDIIDYHYYIIQDEKEGEPSNFEIVETISEKGIKKLLAKLRAPVESEKMNYLKLKVTTYKEINGIKTPSEETVYAKTFVIYALGYELPEGVFLSISKAIDSAAMIIEPIPRKKALSYLPVAVQRLQEMVSRTNDIYLQKHLEMLQTLSERVKYGENVHKFTFIFTIAAKTLEALNDIETEIRQVLRENYIEISAPMFAQKPLYYFNTKAKIFGHNFGLIKPIYTDSYSIAAFYPFISDEIRDPNGIFIGINPYTSGPITYNPFEHRNKNLVILGDTGSGKSMTTKVMVRRMLMKWPEMRLFILDPEGEYAYAREGLGPNISVVHVDPSTKLGLDPLRFAVRGWLPIEMVIDLLTDILEINSSENKIAFKKDVINYVNETPMEKVSIFGLADYILSKKEYHEDPRKKASYLPHIENIKLPPLANIFDGELIEISDRVIFDLHDVTSKETKMAIGSIISAYLYYKVIVSKDIPEGIPKLVVVDEAWIFSQYASVMAIFEDISRRGRKRTVVFMFVTQRPNDVLSNEHGKAVVELAETSILLGMQTKSISAIVDADLYDLNENDIEFLKNASKGEGILRIGDIKTAMQVKVTPREFDIFNTEKFKKETENKESEE